MWNPASSSVTNARRRRLDASGSHGPAAPGRSAQPPPIGAGERPPRGSPRPHAATAGRPAPAPTGQGHPVGGRAASTSSQVDEPEQRQELDGDHPHQQANWLPGRGRAATSRCCDPQRRWPSGPARWRRTPSSTRWPAPAPRPAGHPRTPAEQQRRADRHHGQRDDRVHRAEEPEARARTAPSSERADRVRGGRSSTPGSGGSAPRASAGSRSVPMSRARICSTDRARGICPAVNLPWEPRLEDGDPRTWAVSLWPTRIRQRMGVGWEARVLM